MIAVEIDEGMDRWVNRERANLTGQVVEGYIMMISNMIVRHKNLKTSLRCAELMKRTDCSQARTVDGVSAHFGNDLHASQAERLIIELGPARVLILRRRVARSRYR